jgi:hypothetical protein
MANPFDEFDANPFDEFDESAYQKTGKKYNVLDVAGGVLETATTGALGAFGGIGAAASGAISGAMSPGHTASSGMEDAMKEYGDSTFNKIMAPQTNTGKAIEHGIGTVIEGFKNDLGELASQNREDAPEWAKKGKAAWAAGMSVLPEAAMLAPFRKAGAVRTPEPIVKPKGADLEGALAKLEENPAKADRPVKSPVAEDVARIHDKAIVDRLKEVDREQTLKENFESIKHEDAQALIDRRQAELEFETKKQGTLAYNAAERARQEAAPTGAEWSPAAIAKDVDVRKVDERVTKQEALVAKLEEAVEAGNMPANHLKRATKDLQAARDTLDNIKQMVELEAREKQGNVSGTPAFFSGPGKNQRGAINPEVFKDGFEKLKKLADGTWLRAFSEDGVLKVEARKDGHIVGTTVFDQSPAKGVPFDETPSSLNLEAHTADVVRSERGKGHATEMYKFAAELGNDIQASENQTQAGRAMWEGWENKNFSQGGKISSEGKLNRQRGAIDLGTPERKVLSNIPGIKKHLGNIAPQFMTKEEVITAVKEGKDIDQNALQKLSNNFTKGFLYMADRLQNPMIKYTYDEFAAADRKTRAQIRDEVHGKLSPVIRDMSNKEQAEIWPLIDRADFYQKELNPVFLAEHGFNEKQINAVKVHREVMDKAFEAINRERKAIGKEPIDKRVAYAAMRSTGDFRRLVKDKDNNIVGVISSNFRRKVDSLKKEVEAKGFVVGEERYYGGARQQRGSANESFMKTVEFLAENDPKAQAFIDTLNEIGLNEINQFLNMKRHTMDKKGVQGMSGRQWWKDAEQNAKDGFQAQLNYAEAAFKWGHLAEAAVNVRDVIKAGVEKQPKAAALAEKYLYNALGYNPSKLGHYLENAAAEMFNAVGVGYSIPRHVMATSRKITNTLLLGLNEMFWSTQFIQPFQAMPGMKAMLIAKGLDAGFDFGTGYTYLGKGSSTAMKEQKGQGSALELAAFKYAKDNHVYGADLIEHSNRARKDTGYYADKGGNLVSATAESSTRRVMFYGMVHLLDENGMSPKNGLFEAAHNLTDMALNNYSAMERPHFYSALGPIGDLALFARQMKDDKSARPLIAQLAATVAFSGVTGMIAYAEAEWLYKQITTAMGKPDSLSLRVMKMSEDLTDSNVLSHGGFSMIGADMSKRLGLQELAPNSLFEAAFPGGSKLTDIAHAWYEAGKNRTEFATKKAIKESLPAMAAGPLDRAWFSKETKQGELATNQSTTRGTVIRNTSDKVFKSLGGTGINESVQRQKNYEAEWVKNAYADLRGKALTQAKHELYTDGKVSKDTIRKYVQHEGTPDTLVKDIEKFSKEQNLDAKTLTLLRSTMSESVANHRHAQRLLKIYGNK